MKKYILPTLLILALGLSVGVAQNITKALQLSQDNSGAFGVDASNNIYFPGHVLSAGPGTPVLTSCGSGTPAITGTDTGGVVTTGTSTTGCVITFRTAYGATPWCVISSQNSTYVPSYTASTTALTLTVTATPAYNLNYVCTGSR